MTTTRQDAWTQDEDLLLAEVVLRYIREGGTQLSAFEEVGRQLSRTAAACGFRWNSYVRKQYKSGIELAKKQRKELKKQIPIVEDEVVQQDEVQESFNNTIEAEHQRLTIQNVISFLEQYENSQRDLETIVIENQKLKSKISQLQEEINVVLAEKSTLENNLQIVEDDYKALIEIMERARKMVVLQEDERSKKVKFQMDRNGNLERIEK
ncbi:sporulation-specific transcriptional regulator GerR [Bacillus sp. PS06]|uniref:sporulation-specific transcriptional regulator GerR n=1 Tax=Bacillus sp. PS06 TaxID=2764176 RepID=UPI0017868F30|nr:sporulation-specific transcriptional regulator GerR [Bacillus sp. PS06]MBD8068404.1 sporulation-specific transcriptional regulator GerR [Bacillus sp. PS06]